jgi:heme exporter protein C
MKSRLYPFLVGLVFVLLSYGTYQGLVAAPTEETMGEAQRIFYYHVPAATAAYTLFFVNFLASILYLWRRNQVLDAWAVSSAEVGLVFATVVLITGPIWARYAWGVWWTWDMRLTTFLILWLLYVSYLALRRSAEAASTSVMAAALAIFAFLDVPFSYMANRLFRTNHPQPVTLTSPGMKYALLANMIAFLLFAGLIVWFRFEVERVSQRLAAIHVQRAAQGVAFGLALPLGLFFFQTPVSSRATAHMYGAYIAAWVIYISYLLFLMRKVARLKKEEMELREAK